MDLDLIFEANFPPISDISRDLPDVDLQETPVDTRPEGCQFSDILGGRL
jgi:hypothetical protein